MTADQTTDLTEETPDLYGAYPRLSPHLIAALATAASAGRPTWGGPLPGGSGSGPSS
jgi:hypothetical protein